MSSSRPRRRGSSSSLKVSDSVRCGLRSLCEGKEEEIGLMLDKEVRDAKEGEELLVDVIKVNSITAEMLLARFFDKRFLSEYCINVLQKTGKGSEATLASRIAAEWMKPNFLANQKRPVEKDNQEDEQAKKHKVAKLDVNESDWRYPLFFWKGQLKLEKDGSKWHGTWVAANSLPDSEAFANENEFSLKSSFSGTQEHGLKGGQGEFHGSYQLDQGDGSGHQPYADLLHKFAFGIDTNSDGKLMVGAKGTTDFGHFISLGTAERIECAESAYQLILARRYLKDKDPRVKLKDPHGVIDLVENHETPWDVL